MTVKSCKIEWLVIPAANPAQTAKFYSDIFGWKVEEFTPEFWLFDAETIRGAFAANLKPNPSGIRFSITVVNIEETLQKIEECGGKTVTQKYEIGKGFGFTAAFGDPEGNTVELWAAD